MKDKDIEIEEIVNDEIIKKITAVFIEVVSIIAKSKKIETSYVLIAKKSLEAALEEFKKDIEIMAMRRNHRDLSVGKIAGVLCFRLARGNIVMFKSDDEDLSLLPAICAIATVLKHFVNINIKNIDKTIKNELLYALARRHMNQETLGIIFDTFDKYIEKQSEL